MPIIQYSFDYNTNKSHANVQMIDHECFNINKNVQLNGLDEHYVVEMGECINGQVGDGSAST